MPKITRHRKHPDRYDLAIARPGDRPDREFTWAADPPAGVTRADYEAMMQREAVLLVEAEGQQAAQRDRAGTKIAGEGTDVQGG
jgi:hypothetical protein